MSAQTIAGLALQVAEEGHQEVDQALSWGMGAVSLAILMALLIALIFIGGGREHS